MDAHPDASMLAEQAAVAAASCGKIDEALELAPKALSTKCKGCRQRIGFRMAKALAQAGAMDRIPPLFANVLGVSEARESESLGALARIAAGQGLSEADFLAASKFWTELSEAPPWFLHRGICTLSQIESTASLALEYIVAMAESGTGLLPQPAVDHLIEVVGQLQASAEGDPRARSVLERALSLIESKTDPKHLATAFRREAPYLARTRPALRVHLLQLYQQMRHRGLLAEDISPYAEAIAVMASSDKKNALISLHPEVREAVSLLLSGDFRKVGPSTSVGAARANGRGAPANQER